MWRIVCVGPGFNDTPRRIVDRGPFFPDEARARASAAWLRATGLYESVEILAADVGAVIVPSKPREPKKAAAA